jgi:photosystem II stability/assembly factor-like uncharacterized protein
MIPTARLIKSVAASAAFSSAAVAALPAQTDSLALAGVHWREIGPYRGGRSVTAVGNPSRPDEFWMGTTGGGVFKSITAGQSWAPVTDKFFGGTIGGIAVSASSPDVVYVGGGEYPIRGNVSHGDGMWKTIDGGKTWSFVGLGDTRQIGRVLVDPRSADVVYVAALGHVWAPNPERGVFRSKDGGKTWQKILFRNDSTGAIDLAMDPNNPDVLYAGLWQAGRTPWLLSSGGAGSGMFKSTDGGDHWTEITHNPGLPAGFWGNIGITVSGANSNRIWANIEADSGGVFRSDDGGKTWQLVNTDRNLRQRAWYYTKIHADPKDTNVVYDNNVAFMKSTDGGKTFRPLRGGMQHGDSHDLWIDPKNPNRMIESDDGGAEVSVDGGKTWSEEDFATAQFYHVIATNHFPYHVCGAQQDNSTLCGPSRGDLDISQWLEAGGGESGWIASRGDDPDIVYAGSYGNLLTRKDLRTGIAVNVNPWPDNPMGHPAMDLKYRFQWTFPIIVSKHNPNVVYAGSNVVHKSTNGGKSWTAISPDLTYHDPATLGNSGGPITKDQTSIEYYGTVFIIEESPVTAQTIWTGSDDGKVYLTRNGGVKWLDVTPKDMAKFTRVSSIDASKFGECIAYVAANRFQLDDDKPYLWKTADCGAHWTRIDDGITASEFTRVLREDPAKRGLLVAGTERGIWYSADDGAHWRTLRLNLPIVPVHDLVFKDGDIVIATHGRSFYIMDDISTLEQISDAVLASSAHLFRPRDQYRLATGGGFGGGGGRGGGTPAQVTPENAPIHPTGQNPPTGVVVQYWLGAAGDTVTLDFLDATGKLIRGYSSKPDSAAQAGQAPEEAFAPPPAPRVPNKKGVNTFVWNLRYPDASSFPGMILWAASVTGPLVPPGTYKARLAVNGKPIGTETFRVLADPRIKATLADWQEQSRVALAVRDRFSEANDAVKEIRRIKSELADREKKMPADKQSQLTALSTPFATALSEVEDSLYQTKNRSGQDPLNYPIRLNNRIGALLGVIQSSDGRPTEQSYEVDKVLGTELNKDLTKLRATISANLPRINAMLRAAGLKEIESKGPIA